MYKLRKKYQKLVFYEDRDGGRRNCWTQHSLVLFKIFWLWIHLSERKSVLDFISLLSGYFVFPEGSPNIPEITIVSNETDSAQKTDAFEPDTLGNDNNQSSLKKAVSTDSLDEALDSALGGSAKDKDKSVSEKQDKYQEAPIIGLVNTEPPPLTENSDDTEDDDQDFFDSEERKE